MVTPAFPAADAGQSPSLRAQFLNGLSPRLNTLSAMVESLGGDGETSTVKESLVRRLRAMRAAADTVGLEEVAGEFDACAAALANQVWSSAVQSELRERLDAALRLGKEAEREQDHEAGARPSGAAPAPSSRANTPVGPFTVVALASESQKVILRQALEQADEFNLYCSQDAGEAAALLATYDPDLFVVDGRRGDVAPVVSGCQGCPVMVVDARLKDVAGYQKLGARWVTTIGEHYETKLLESLRHRRRSQSMIAPRGDGAMTLTQFAEDVATEVKQALLDTASGSSDDTLLPLGEGTSVQTAVWSMLARLRETVSELSHGAVKYDPHTPSGAMIVTGKDAMRRGGRARASAENLAGRKILVAEDDTSVGWYLTSLLRSKGAIVSEAGDGIEALRQARRDAPDLVICDVMLPALDGFALCRNLKHDVALSDVPVILLSWKEDLLQRVRELGAGADGYLAKEAEASVIVERCAEALEPRARIEKRLMLERVVHGRLDGVTPRLVLQLASHAVDNAKVILQDAAFQYEVCLGDGRILTARRKAADGTMESGEKVLPGLLGMRAGRFTVERIRGNVQAELYGSVDKVLAPFIERARRATRRLKGAELYDVSRLVIDTTALEPYLSVSPPIVNSIVKRLRDGAAPGDLLHSVSASLLESVLEDLALRGGVLSVLTADGDDLLEEEQRDSVAAFDMELKSARSPRLEAASGAPVVGPGSSADEAAAAAAFARDVNLSSGSNRPSHAPVFVAAPSRSAETALLEIDGERRSSIPPSDARSTVLGLAPEARRPDRASGLPPLPQATLTREEDSRGQKGTPTVRPRAADDTPPSGMQWDIPEAELSAPAVVGGLEEGPSEPAPELSSADGLARALGGWTPVEARVSRREDVGRVVLEPNEDSDGGLDLAEVVAGLGATPTPIQVQVVRRPLVKVTSGVSTAKLEVNPETTVGAVRAEHQTLTGLGALPPAGDAAATEQATSNLLDSWRAPNLTGRTAAGALESEFDSGGLPPVEGRGTPHQAASTREAQRPERSEVPPPPVEELSTPALGASAVEPKPADLALPVRSLQPPSPLPPPAQAPPPSGVGAKRLDALQTDEPPGVLDEPHAFGRRQEDVPSFARQETTDEVLAAAGLSNTGGGWWSKLSGGLRPVGIVTVAALGAFLGMNQLARWFAPDTDQQTSSALAPTASAPAAAVALGPDEVDDLVVAPPGEQRVARKTVAKATELPLPEGLTVPAGKGLLEVDSGGQHKLYVDNVFVGRGPLRRIPLDPGTHRVQTQLDGVEEVHDVDVIVGRRARIELTESGQ